MYARRVAESNDFLGRPRQHHVFFRSGVAHWRLQHSKGKVVYRVISPGTCRDCDIDRLPEYRADSQRQAYDTFLARVLAEYRDRAPSAEELSEMRAAFGPGTAVVNVLTGRRTKL